MEEMTTGTEQELLKKMLFYARIRTAVVLVVAILLVLCGILIVPKVIGTINQANQIMEQAILQINAYLDGDCNARIECDNEGELYRLFHSINSLAAVLNAHADNELREKEFEKYNLRHFTPTENTAGSTQYL